MNVFTQDGWSLAIFRTGLQEAITTQSGVASPRKPVDICVGFLVAAVVTQDQKSSGFNNTFITL